MFYQYLADKQKWKRIIQENKVLKKGRCEMQKPGKQTNLISGLKLNPFSGFSWSVFVFLLRLPSSQACPSFDLSGRLYRNYSYSRPTQGRIIWLDRWCDCCWLSYGHEIWRAKGRYRWQLLSAGRPCCLRPPARLIFCCRTQERL